VLHNYGEQHGVAASLDADQDIGFSEVTAIHQAGDLGCIPFA
jgi:hypothetical protein